MWVCLDIYKGETNRNRWLVILLARTYYWTLIACQKLGQSDLLYGSKSPAEKVGMNIHFQASWASQSMGCLFVICVEYESCPKSDWDRIEMYHCKYCHNFWKPWNTSIRCRLSFSISSVVRSNCASLSSYVWSDNPVWIWCYDENFAC